MHRDRPPIAARLGPGGEIDRGATRCPQPGEEVCIDVDGVAVEADVGAGLDAGDLDRRSRFDHAGLLGWVAAGGGWVAAGGGWVAAASIAQSWTNAST